MNNADIIYLKELLENYLSIKKPIYPITSNEEDGYLFISSIEKIELDKIDPKRFYILKVKEKDIGKEQITKFYEKFNIDSIIVGNKNTFYLITSDKQDTILLLDVYSFTSTSIEKDKIAEFLANPYNFFIEETKSESEIITEEASSESEELKNKLDNPKTPPKNNISESDILVLDDLIATNTEQPPSQSNTSEDIRTILVLEKSLSDEDIKETIKKYNHNGLYNKIKIINFFAMYDEDKKPYILQCIEKLKSMATVTTYDKQVKLYDEFKKICEKWFLDLKKYNITDVACRRVYHSDRAKTTPIIAWLYGYYIIGKECKWLLTKHKSIKILSNEFEKLDKKEDLRNKRIAKDLLNANPIKQFVASNLNNYIILGVMNSMIEKDIPEIWKSDNITFEAHIIKNFGNYKGDVFREPLEKFINILKGTNPTIIANYDIYETFLTKYFNLA